jgi:hypothetical protein
MHDSGEYGILRVSSQSETLNSSGPSFSNSDYFDKPAGRTECERGLGNEVEPLTDVELPGEALGEVGGRAARLLLHRLHVHLLPHLVFILLLLVLLIPLLLVTFVVFLVMFELVLIGALLRGWSAEPGGAAARGRGEREEERARGGGGGRGLSPEQAGVGFAGEVSGERGGGGGGRHGGHGAAAVGEQSRAERRQRGRIREGTRQRVPSLTGGSWGCEYGRWVRNVSEREWRDGTHPEDWVVYLARDFVAVFGRG